MSHCSFRTCDCKVNLSDIVNAAKQYFHRGCGGYSYTKYYPMQWDSECVYLYACTPAKHKLCCIYKMYMYILYFHLVLCNQQNVYITCICSYFTVRTDIHIIFIR